MVVVTRRCLTPRPRATRNQGPGRVFSLKFEFGGEGGKPGRPGSESEFKIDDPAVELGLETERAPTFTNGRELVCQHHTGGVFDERRREVMGASIAESSAPIAVSGSMCA